MTSVLAGLLDFGIAFCVLIGMLIYYGYAVTSAIVTIPVFILLAALTALGAGLWLSTLNVRYRDIRYITPFLIQFWLFLTPIAYPSTIVPEKWRALYGLNPMVGVVEGFRWALLGGQQAPAPVLAASVVMMVVMLVSGLYFFRRMEKKFADIL
jgi:lipopolysaccharide transport system permease protein